LQGLGPDTPSSYCCAGTNTLNQKANTTQIRRNICNCLKPVASRFGVHSDRSKQLPQLCNISLSLHLILALIATRKFSSCFLANNSYIHIDF
jgi:hypothetical protein